MPVRTIPGLDLTYFLVAFDTLGMECAEPDGSYLSERAKRTAANLATPPTDVFFLSHGWFGDVPAACAQYDKWIATMAGLRTDYLAAATSQPSFLPLIVGLHWPSLPWGDENVGTAAASGLLSLDSDGGDERFVQAYASNIADSTTAREAIRALLVEARTATEAQLSDAARRNYANLLVESGLVCRGAAARPGADQPAFDPDAIVAEAHATPRPSTGTLGISDLFKDAVLAPLRLLSFWKMKDRARQFGETGAHKLLRDLQTAAPAARFHLMGHSFGCIVASTAIAGAPNTEDQGLARPVDSLFLVQGALSLWSFANSIPYAGGSAGYFHRVVERGLIRGPIVTTRSTHDSAVGIFYPLGAHAAGQIVLREDYPAYGGVGAFGIRGLERIEDLPMRVETYKYQFQPSAIYNLDASAIIKNGSGAAGAHSDIAHPEVAHAFWEAILAAFPLRRGPLVLEVAPTTRGFDLNSFTRGQTLDRQPSGAGSGGATRQRWINAQIEDLQPGEALEVNHWNTLAFDVDDVQHADAVGTLPFKNADLFRGDEDEVVLTVQLDSDDFELSERARPMRVPRSGRSHTKARFDVSPKHDGAGTIVATITRDNNFIQQMTLRFVVGAKQQAPMQLEARGRSLTAAAVVRERDLTLIISPAVGGYSCILCGPVSSRALLPLQPAQLAAEAEVARGELLKVVSYQDASGNFVFQTGVDIAPVDQAAALKIMAEAGARLFQQVFFGPGADAASQLIGNFLKDSAKNPATRLKLQIVAESTPLPWGLLYMGDVSFGAQLSWSNFLGMRHIVEQIPLQPLLSTIDTSIPSDRPKLNIALALDETIDAQMRANFVAQQKTFWDSETASRALIKVLKRTTRDELLAALASGDADEQILYFYCHAKAAGLAAPLGPDASAIQLSDGSLLTLRDLNLQAPAMARQLRGAPLIFINACESADLSPAFYDGFVPYFMAKGARGVIGTECKTPALFAAAWAKCFFERFLAGEPLGQIFLNLRIEFLERQGNPLGLLYAMHCDGDTRIEPPISMPATT